jgi:S1-C subfamily serine protease
VQVQIESQGEDYATPWRRPSSERSSGTAFSIGEGRLLTNAHVVSDAKTLRVKRADRAKLYEARVLFAGHDCDLAILAVDEADFWQEMQPLELGDSPTIQSTVSAVGYPMGGNKLSFTEGVVSRIEVRPYSHSGGDEHLTIQIDAAINPGNSGGALLDSSGRLIGINTAIVRAAQGIGFAIPVDHARIIMDQIVAHGRVTRAALGVAIRGEIDPPTARARGLSVDYGVVVVPEAGSPAERAGIRADDIIVAVDGQKVTNISELRREVFRKKPGDSVKVEVVRGAQRMTFTVVLTEFRGSAPQTLTA